jgi:hypothetical protein
MSTEPDLAKPWWKQILWESRSWWFLVQLVLMSWVVYLGLSSLGVDASIADLLGSLLFVIGLVMAWRKRRLSLGQAVGGFFLVLLVVGFWEMDSDKLQPQQSSKAYPKALVQRCDTEAKNSNDYQRAFFSCLATAPELSAEEAAIA